MRYSNIHNHSTFSDGKHTMEENILSAIEKNMLSLGFSDHSFTACDTSYCMKEENYTEYLQTIRHLKETYADKLPIFAGMELDYYSELDANDYDYIIASVHYIVKDVSATRSTTVRNSRLTVLNMLLTATFSPWRSAILICSANMWNV